MKFTSVITGAIFICLTFCSVAKDIDKKVLTTNQMAVVVEGTVLSMVKNAITNGRSPFEIIIIQDAKIRDRLSLKYADFNKWMRIESEAAVVYRNAYIYKKTNQKVYVNRFKLVRQEKDKCEVEWSRTLSSLGGEVKKVTLVLSEKDWSILKIELEGVS